MSDHTRVPYFPANLDDYAPWVAEHGLTAPYGQCQCGCGEPAPIARYNNSKRGHIEGQFLRFRPFHRARLPRDSVTNRFWSKVDKSGDCWEWTAAKSWFGYGSVGYKSKVQYAHRVAWELTFGPIPDGLHVLHRCDNPGCVNPEHLWLGTPLDNARDKEAKGRGNHISGNPNGPESIFPGEQNGNAKLTETDVRKIRQVWADGTSIRFLSRKYKVSRTQIQRIVRRQSWTHI